MIVIGVVPLASSAASSISVPPIVTLFSPSLALISIVPAVVSLLEVGFEPSTSRASS